jgi:hypothetical protein
MFKDQLTRLFNAPIRLEVSVSPRSTHVVTGFDLGFPRDARQRVLRLSTVSLTIKVRELGRELERQLPDFDTRVAEKEWSGVNGWSRAWEGRARASATGQQSPNTNFIRLLIKAAPVAGLEPVIFKFALGVEVPLTGPFKLPGGTLHTLPPTSDRAGHAHVLDDLNREKRLSHPRTPCRSKSAWRRRTANNSNAGWRSWRNGA